jgi:hypothetical protein
MRTDQDSDVSLFLFPHQDDEFAVFSVIEREVMAGHRVLCVYITDGAATADPDRRDAESRAVLRQLGVPDDDILFLGRQLGFADGRLYLAATSLAEWFEHFLFHNDRVTTCFVPAWEGGHPDHDILHAVVAESSFARTGRGVVWQFPLYNGYRLSGPFFRVCAALPGNGHVERSVLSWKDRFRYLRLCLTYRSQWRSWVGLLPLLCLHYIVRGDQPLQRVDRHKLSAPPHAGRLYYERRAFLDWPTLRDSIAPLHRPE